MGLDISVYRPIIPDGSKRIDEDDYYILSENPELECFSSMSFEKENSYYDLDETIKLLGKNSEDLIWTGTSYGRRTIFSYLDTKHELYAANQFFEAIWHSMDFNSLGELRNSDYFKEYKEKYLPVMKRHGYKPRYKTKSSDGRVYYSLNHPWKISRLLVEIKIINPPTYKKMERCILCEEVGYQRKGANKKFYEDGMWDSPCVVDLKTLNDHWERYFSHSTPESNGGWGSSVEYKQDDGEMKENFKRNIIDNFIEGETFVVYH